MNLTEEEQAEAKRVLDTLDKEEINMLAFDMKYDVEWYEQRIEELREIESYLEELTELMKAVERENNTLALNEYRRNIESLIQMYEDAIEDLEQLEQH